MKEKFQAGFDYVLHLLKGFNFVVWLFSLLLGIVLGVMIPVQDAQELTAAVDSDPLGFVRLLFFCLIAAFVAHSAFELASSGLDWVTGLFVADEESESAEAV